MASLSSLSINRPVLAIVASILIVLFGLIGISRLGIREYPVVDAPIITVSAGYTGANADVIESQITEPLEESINGIAGIRSLTSTSREGRGSITVEFGLDVDLEAAANDVRDRVARAQSLLPPEADVPTVAKADADANPIVFVSIRSDKRSLTDLTEIANTTLKERLQTIPGVSEVRIWGERRYAMRLWLDPIRMAAYNITPSQVQDALARENIELPAGRIEGRNTELAIRAAARLTSAEEFNNLLIRPALPDAGGAVFLKDIGQASLEAENERTLLKRDGIPMVGVAITPQPGTNQIAIADEFHKRIKTLKTQMPSDITLELGFDNTDFIRASVSEVEETIMISFGLVVLIVFLFLREWRTTLIPVVAIPISLIGTFFVMYLCGFTINVLTLLGIVLAIGLVVDDAIVVIENIYAKIESGMPPLEAAQKGSEEIYFVVISTTITLAAVFLPIVFLDGVTGKLFREFGVVVASAVLISAFVSLTLTPMMSAYMLGHKKPSVFYRKTEPFFVSMTDFYTRSIEKYLRYRWISVVLVLVLAGFTYVLYKQIPSELSPAEDRNAFRIAATGPEGATFEYMESYTRALEALVDSSLAAGEKQTSVAVTSPGFSAGSAVNSAFVRVLLTPSKGRQRSQAQIAEAIFPKINSLSAARAFIVQEQSIGSGRGGGLPVQLVLMASSMQQLTKILPVFQAQASQNPAFSFINVNLKFNKPELQLNIDRLKAQTLGVSIVEIARTLQLALSGQRFGYFIYKGRQYQVIGQLDRSFRNEPSDLSNLSIADRQGRLVRLDNLASFSETSASPQIFRYNRYVSATVSAQLSPGYTLGQGVEAMQTLANTIDDPDIISVFEGTSREYLESSSSILFSLLLALVLIYLILAAQFESFKDPIIILLTVPLALFGALFSLWFFGQTLNIFSQIGIVMLIGLVTKNGILIVEFANQYREKNTDILAIDAIVIAASQRLRPILMTSLAAILGVMPIALALGAGAESRVSMGIAVVGGMLFSTFLTLFVVPAFYLLLSRKKAVANSSEQILIV